MRKLQTRDVDGIAAALEAGESFETGGELRGLAGGLGYLGTGRLPLEWQGDACSADYVVLSWQTPIAWRLPGGWWVRPLVKYSITTTRHQTTVDGAIGYVTSERVDNPAYEGARVRQ